MKEKKNKIKKDLFNGVICKEGNRQTAGITLIALVITIIILLILAGIAIANIGGENSLINKSKKAKREHEISQAQELLSTELLGILAGNQGNKNLKDLDNLNIRGYTTKVSNIARLITMSKNNETFYFLVDSDYNIESLNNNNNFSQGNTGESSSQTGNLKSELINDFNIKLEEQSGLKAKINIDGEITTKDNSGVFKYIVLVNGQAKSIENKMPCEINLDKTKTTYEIGILAIDTNGKFKNSNSNLYITTPDAVISVLDYPILTNKGVANIKCTTSSDSNDFYYDLDLSVDCTAADALNKAAYDGNEETYSLGPNRKLLVDKSAIGMSIKTIWKTSTWRVINIYNSSGSLIAYSPNFISTLTTYVMKIPEDASYILVGYDSDAKCYEIQPDSEN